jgi:hypothetical protein
MVDDVAGGATDKFRASMISTSSKIQGLRMRTAPSESTLAQQYAGISICFPGYDAIYHQSPLLAVGRHC